MESGLLTAEHLIRVQEAIGWRLGYLMGGDRRAGYTAARFAADLNTLHPGIVRVSDGRPHQLYHARCGAMQVPQYWAPVVHELWRLARIGFTYPPTPGPLWPRSRRWQWTWEGPRNTAKALAVDEAQIVGMRFA